LSNKYIIIAKIIFDPKPLYKHITLKTIIQKIQKISQFEKTNGTISCTKIYFSVKDMLRKFEEIWGI
jgi:hypothetical protein